MGVKAVTTIIGLYILVVVSISFWFWGDLSKGELSVSATIRNLVLMGGTPLAILLAVWRSMIAEKQVKVAQRQTDILFENQQMAVRRDQPKLLLRQDSSNVGRPTKDGYTSKYFDGFAVANAGAVDVTITNVGALFAISVDNPDDRSVPALPLAPKKWDGFDIQGNDLPVKLEPGATARFMFDSNALERINRPYKWRCRDSLGTVYEAEGWWMRSQDTLVYMELGVGIGAKFIAPNPLLQMWA